jgi:PiT family inorganic phosphate transporter
MFGLDNGMTIILITCIVAACIFEFINGFHDTANAVATVIYTNSMKPSVAVVWSGVFNFIGVYLGGIGVAIGIINLLPMSLLTDQSINHNIAMILSIIISSIIWNLGTWYFGIPCSSSHTLLGSLFGVGLAFSLLPGVENVGLNWAKVKDAGLSLMLSPLIGFGLTMGIVILVKKISKKLKNNILFEEPKKKKSPPPLIRGLLILTCTSVSYSHGSNDGQKGVGLLMIILIALAPLSFSVNHSMQPEKLLVSLNQIDSIVTHIDQSELTDIEKGTLTEANKRLDSMQVILAGTTSFDSLQNGQHQALRKNILISAKLLKNITDPNEDYIHIKLEPTQKKQLNASIADMKSFTEYAPWWVILIISLSLGIGTMVGWKRIVVTIGEKIGKEHLTYAQGASAELVAASTILISTTLKLPVSTTHILSSGVAGSMVATNGLKNLRKKTLKNILIAWLVTLPVTIILSGGLFLLISYLFK